MVIAEAQAEGKISAGLAQIPSGTQLLTPEDTWAMWERHNGDPCFVAYARGNDVQLGWLNDVVFSGLSLAQPDAPPGHPAMFSVVKSPGNWNLSLFVLPLDERTTGVTTKVEFRASANDTKLSEYIARTLTRGEHARCVELRAAYLTTVA